MIFNANIINHTLPAVSVNSDSNVTYAQIKNSLGQQVYKAEEFYLYSTNFSQLIGVINYNIYDVSGNQNITNIVTTTDPYQVVSSVFVDLTQREKPIILNGNSNFSTTILPNTYLQFQLYNRRITNSFGMNLFNFKELEKITKTNFFNNYGHPIEEIQAVNNEIMQSISKEKALPINTDTDITKSIKENDNKIVYGLLSFIAISSLYVLYKIKD